MGLKRYKEKRNFRATPEPAGKVGRRKEDAPMFVIQKHDATRLHYDFRLEMEGVLKSWAVPKGIPTTKGEKRLAMHVEDHPLDYGDFEGVIPEGNYGAGSVMVWDTGSWEPLGGDPLADLRDGKLHFALHGQKLNGEWTLVRMRPRAGGSGKDEWLLIKSGADIKPISARHDDESVVSHRSMAEIAGQKTRTWESNRGAAASPANSVKSRIAAAARRAATATASGHGPESETSGRSSSIAAAGRQPARSRLRKAKPQKSGRKKDVSAPATDSSALKGCPAEAPAFVEPMKARLVDALPREDLLLELKHDGYRAVAVKNGASVHLYSRNHRDITGEFPSVSAAVKAIPAERAVLDGEIVAMDPEGHASFQLLQNRGQLRNDETIAFYVFDLLNLDGRNVRALPLTRRRELLQPLADAPGEPIRFSVALNGAPDVVLAEVKRLGLEGVIAKRPQSKYESGRRSGAWIKVKCVNEQEFVIGGYTPPKGSRDYFGSLIVGYYEDRQLVFASKVGSGYSQKTLRDLHHIFGPLRRPACPFVNLPTKRSGKFGQGLSAAEMRRCTWLEPKLVAQVRFTEWTSDGGLRHPVFLGLREDKAATEVKRERAAEPGRREEQQ